MSGLLERVALRDQLSESVRALGVAADGLTLAVADAKGELRLYDLHQRRPLARARLHEAGVTALSWRPDGAVVTCASEDGALRSFSRRGEVTQHLAPGDAWAEQAAWSPDGRLLAASVGRQLHLWRADGAPLGPLPARANTIAALAWSPYGRMLAVASFGGVELLDATTGAVAARLPWTSSLLSLAWRPDAEVLAACCQDNSLHFWRLPSGEDAEMRGYARKPLALSWRSDGALLASSGGAEVTVWDFRDGPEGTAPLVLGGHAGAVTALAFAPGLEILASGCRAGSLAVWAPGGAEDVLGDDRLDASVTGLAWCAPPKQAKLWLAVGGAQGALVVYSALSDEA